MVLQELIEAEATEVIGAERYERTESRVTERNGSRPRVLSTKAGDLSLRVLKLRAGSFFPVILEPRRRIDQALYGLVSLGGRFGDGAWSLRWPWEGSQACRFSGERSGLVKEIGQPKARLLGLLVPVEGNWWARVRSVTPAAGLGRGTRSPTSEGVGDCSCRRVGKLLGAGLLRRGSRGPPVLVSAPLFTGR